MDQELKNKIKESGNNLHLEVADYLYTNGWNIDLSPYYCDDITKIPREIDIVATKTFPFCFRNPEEDKFDVYLFIECKRFLEKFAFRVVENNQETGRSVLVSQNYNIFSKKEDLNRSNLLNTHHYFIEKKISRLWDSASAKERQEKDIFDAVTQPIKSLIFLEREVKRRAIFYPLVICDGISGFYGVEEAAPETVDAYLENLKETSQLTFGLRYAYKGRMVQGTEMSRIRDFYIDFILRDNLKKYLSSLEKNEIEEVGKYLQTRSLKISICNKKTSSNPGR